LHILSQIIVICLRVKTGFSVAGFRCAVSLESIMNSAVDDDDGDIGGDGE
jgi:hypothetical protein